MVRKRLRAVSLIPSLFKVALLLSQFILYKIGSIPLLIIKLLIFISSIFFKILSRKFSPKRVKISAVLSVTVGLIITTISFFYLLIYQLPSPKYLTVSQKPITSEFYARDGTLLYRLYEDKNRDLVNLDKLPPQLINATIAIEDKNFYKHMGFDPEAIARALFHNTFYSTGEGASTITQQLIKNTLLTNEKTLTRKLKEIILAFWAERIYTKSEILQMYFNEVAYGGPTWGVEAASKVYFGKVASDLNLAESAFLAGLPASPTQFSPYGTNPGLAKLRQIQVLEKMVKEKFISEKEKNEAISYQLDLKPRENNILAPHFVFYVKDLLSQKYGSRVVSQGGLKIYTTLDLDLQKEAENIVSSEVESLKYLNVTNGAAMVTDAKTGQILAMVGSKNYYDKDSGNVNVTLRLRQPGSSIKPVTYAAAFKKGVSPANTVLDVPTVFKDAWGYTYKPLNYDGRFRGPVSIRQALGSSLNLPAVKVLNMIGVTSMIETAKDLGITTFNPPAGKSFGLSLTLGGGEVKMIDMMGVYGAFADSGRLHPITPILKVVNSEGKVLKEFEDQPKQAISEEVAYLITNILSDNNTRLLAFGPNSLLNINPNVAVKTGTSDNKRDNLTYGFTKDFVVGVWVGNNNNAPMNPALTSGITGAAPIWNKITRLLLNQHPSSTFPRPQGITEAFVDGRLDLAIKGYTNKSLVRIKREQGKLIFQDETSTFSTSSAQVAAKNGL